MTALSKAIRNLYMTLLKEFWMFTWKGEDWEVSCCIVLVAQSCLTLCDSLDCSPPGSSVHGILQARMLEWVAIPFSRRSSWPRDQTQVSHIAGRFFTIWATREPWCRWQDEGWELFSNTEGLSTEVDGFRAWSTWSDDHGWPPQRAEGASGERMS